VSPLRRVLGIVTLLSANVQAAEHDWPVAPRVNDAQQRVSLSLSNRAGLVKAPFVTAAFPEVSGFGVLLTGDVAVRISELDWLRSRLPLSIARVDFPARAQVAETAFGNLELGLEHRVQLRPSTRLWLLAAWLAPTAQHGPENSLLQNRALALASALNAGQASALLTPGVTGVRLAVGVEHSLRPFEFRASLDLPLLVRVSAASLPKEPETHAVGLMPALELRAAWWISSSFGASLGAGLITEPWRVQEPALERDRARRLQPLVAPALHAQLGKHVALTLDGSIPVGGSLGGEAWSVGLQGRVLF
jgi:hypothetical protein